MGSVRATFFLAFKSIVKGNRWALAMIIIVMSLSFANMMLTPSIISGVTRALDQQQIDTVCGNIVLDPPASDYYLNDVSQTVEKLLQYPGVAGAAPRLSQSALIEYRWADKESPTDKGISGTWPVIGVDPASESAVTNVHSSFIAGSYLEPGDTNAIVLGVNVAGGDSSAASSFRTLEGVSVGDSVRLTYPNGVQREYTVKGIYLTKEGQTDASAFVTRGEMASVLGQGTFSDQASQVLIKIDQQGAELSVMGGLDSLGINGVLRSWQDYGGSVGNVASSFDAIASLVSGIGLVVAAIVMFIVIYISVLARKRQIGILRAIGVKRIVIVFSYVIQAMFYALLGVLFGGLGFGYGIVPYFQTHPLDLSIGRVSLSPQPVTVTVAVWGIVVAALLAGVLPALNITRQSMTQAIWGD